MIMKTKKVPEKKLVKEVREGIRREHCRENKKDGCKG